MIALITVQWHMAVAVSGYLSENSIDFLLKVKELMDETGNTRLKNRILREKLEMTVKQTRV